MKKQSDRKQPSEARRAASRANGAKSKGPVTPEGKQRSSRNALKHGLLASALTMPGDEARNYQCYFDGYSWRLEPRDLMENDYVERIAYGNYRLRMAWLMHHRTLDIQMANDAEGAAANWENLSHLDRLTIAFANSLKNTSTLPTLSRYMRQFELSSDKALREFRALRAEPLPPGPPAKFPNEPENSSEPAEPEEVIGEIDEPEDEPQNAQAEPGPEEPSPEPEASHQEPEPAQQPESAAVSELIQVPECAQPQPGQQPEPGPQQEPVPSPEPGQPPAPQRQPETGRQLALPERLECAQRSGCPTPQSEPERSRHP